MADPEWLEAAKRNGLTITGQGVNLDALAGSVPARAPDDPRPDLTVRNAVDWFRFSVTNNCRSERQLQGAVMTLAKALGWRRAHFRPARVMRGGKEIYETPIDGEGKGFLDLELVRERLVKVELKFGKNKPSEEQLAWLAAYRAAGVECYVWYPRDCETILEVLTCRRPATQGRE
jgi:hypothetical protein